MTDSVLKTALAFLFFFQCVIIFTVKYYLIRFSKLQLSPKGNFKGTSEYI